MDSDSTSGLHDLDKEWLLKTVNHELQRLRSMGAKPIPFTTKNFTMIVEGTPIRVINKVELDTGFDFDKINQILVSESITYPHDSKWHYAHVLLITNASSANPNTTQFPIIIPYLYTPIVTIGHSSIIDSANDGGGSGKKKKNQIIKNELRDWLLVNNSGKSSRHVVHEFIHQ